MSSNDYHFNKYAEILDVQPSFPSLELLCRIVKSHLIKIPFENISKLYYKKSGMNYIPDLSIYLEGIKKYNFGGTCYSNNYYLYLFLKHLGYDVKLCGADMNNPDVHIVSVVKIDEEEYLIDGGFGAPFLAPLPLDWKKDYLVELGNEKYFLKPKDKMGRSKIELYNDGELKQYYIVKPEPRRIEYFREVIESSYEDSAMFMNIIRIFRFTEIGSVMLRNLKLTETSGLHSSILEISEKDLPSLVEEKFGIPQDIVSVACLKMFTV